MYQPFKNVFPFMDQRADLASQRQNIQSLLLPQTTQILDRSRLNIIRFMLPLSMCPIILLVEKCETLKNRVNDHIVISSTVPNMRSRIHGSLCRKRLEYTQTYSDALPCIPTIGQACNCICCAVICPGPSPNPKSQAAQS